MLIGQKQNVIWLIKTVNTNVYINYPQPILGLEYEVGVIGELKLQLCQIVLGKCNRRVHIYGVGKGYFYSRFLKTRNLKGLLI